MTALINRYRTLIADDEQPARDRLKKLLAEHTDQIELIGVAENGIQCVEMIDRLKPDLVFVFENLCHLPKYQTCPASLIKFFEYHRRCLS